MSQCRATHVTKLSVSWQRKLSNASATLGWSHAASHQSRPSKIHRGENPSNCQHELIHWPVFFFLHLLLLLPRCHCLIVRHLPLHGLIWATVFIRAYYLTLKSEVSAESFQVEVNPHPRVRIGSQAPLTLFFHIWFKVNYDKLIKELRDLSLLSSSALWRLTPSFQGCWLTKGAFTQYGCRSLEGGKKKGEPRVCGVFLRWKGKKAKRESTLQKTDLAKTVSTAQQTLESSRGEGLLIFKWLQMVIFRWPLWKKYFLYGVSRSLVLVNHPQQRKKNTHTHTTKTKLISRAL